MKERLTAINTSLLLSLLILLLWTPFPAQGADKDKKALWNEGMKHLSNNDSRGAEECGKQLRKDKGDAEAILYSDIILGQSALMREDYSEAYRYLRNAERHQEIANDSVRGSVYNGLGLYEVNAEQDFNKALEYFFAGLDYAKKGSHKNLYAIILNNIVGVYYLKKDPSGLEYALECYEIGEKKKNPMLMYAGAEQTALMYLLKNDLDNASLFARKALDITLKENLLNYESEAYITMGDVANKKGEYEQAMKCFTEAEKYAGNRVDFQIRALYGKAESLKGKGEYSQAIALLDKALQFSDKSGVSLFRSDVLLALSELCEL